MCKKHELDYTVFNLNWKNSDDYIGLAEDEAKRIINSNESVHINGRAGTGKTYLVNKFIEELKFRNKVVRGFSPTNKGAVLINGKTIHTLCYKFQK